MGKWGGENRPDKEVVCCRLMWLSKSLPLRLAHHLARQRRRPPSPPSLTSYNDRISNGDRLYVVAQANECPGVINISAIEWMQATAKRTKMTVVVCVPRCSGKVVMSQILKAEQAANLPNLREATLLSKSGQDAQCALHTNTHTHTHSIHHGAHW